MNTNFGKLAPALGHLSEALDLRDLYRQAQQHYHVRLSEHPFGFDGELSGRLSNAVYLVANPADTDSSVHNMALMLLREAMKYGTEGFGRQLRIVRFPVDKDSQTPHTTHDLYFELITDDGTYMCGGCSDTGARGEGGKKLEAIFGMFAEIWSEEVEVKTLLISSDEVRTVLCELYDKVPEGLQKVREEVAY